MIARLSTQQSDFQEKLSKLLAWESVSNNDINKIVDEIIAEIQNKGDKALLIYTIELDLVEVDSIFDLIISKEKLKKSLKSDIDIFVTSGAISAGKFDFIPELIKELSFKTYFKGVSIKPGRPIMLSKFNRKKKLFFGLLYLRFLLSAHL